MFRNLKLAFFLAVRAIVRSDKSSLFLTIFIMAVVFLNLLFIDSIFAGISKAMDEEKINYQFGEVIIELESGEQYIKNASGLVNSIRDYFYVKNVASRLITVATLENDKNKDGRDVATFTTGVVGINPEKDNNAIDIKANMIAGRYLRKGDFGKAILGADVAGGYGSSVFPDDLEGVRVGDKITVKFTDKSEKEYEIVGIFKTKNFDTDSKMFVTRRDLDRVLGTSKEEASEIIVRLADKNFSKQAIRDFKKIYSASGFEVADWEEKLAFGRKINKSFDMVGNILRIIGALVAGLVIFIVIFVEVVNRRKQIGILKAIGLPETVLVYSYIIQGLFFILIGILLGYFLMSGGIIGFFKKYPIDFPMGWVVPVVKNKSLRVSIELFLLSGFIGSLFPAWREVRKRILDLMK